MDKIVGRGNIGSTTNTTSTIGIGSTTNTTSTIGSIGSTTYTNSTIGIGSIGSVGSAGNVGSIGVGNVGNNRNTITGLTQKQEAAVKVEARERCRTDLHYLAKHVLGYDRLTDRCHKRMAMDIDTPKYRFKLLLWPRGHYKCLEENSKIYMVDGSCKKIKDIVVGDFVWGIDDIILQVLPSKVVAAEKTQQQEVFRICTKHGFNLLASDEHAFRVMEGYSELRNLKVGDRVASPRHLHTANKAVKLDVHNDLFWDTVEKIESVGVCQTYDFQTTSGNYIAEGFVVHNTTIGTESRCVQKLLRDPNERILITNAKLDNSRKFLRAISQHFSSSAKLRWLWRNYWLQEYTTVYDKVEYGDRLDWILRDTQDELIMLRPYTGREASVTTGAVDSSLVSQHYSTILADDVINRDYVRTMDMVEKSILYFKDLLDLLDPKGSLEIIGTRWSHMDLYGWLIQEFGGIASLRVPENYVSQNIVAASEAVSEDKKDWMISIQPCYDSEGKPIFPEEFSLDILHNLEKAKGPYEFGAQYRLDPTPGEHQKFQEEWFQRLDVMPDPSNLTGCITIDPAISTEADACDSVLVVCGYDDRNRMYFYDGFAEKLSEDELLEAVFSYVSKWQKRFRFLLPVGFEAVSFQRIYIYNLERMMLEQNNFFTIEAIKRSGSVSKDERILRLVPRIKNDFFMPKRLVKQSLSGRWPEYDLSQRMLWQFLKFPFAGAKDIADAMADQLEIAQAQRLPTQTNNPQQSQRKKDFVHLSILQDQKKWPKKELHRYNDAVR